MDSILTEKLTEHLLARNKTELFDILLSPDKDRNYSLIINFLILLEENVEIGNGLLIEPEIYLSAFNDAAILAQKNIVQHVNEAKDKYNIKTKVSVRIEGLPLFNELSFPSNNDIGSLVKLNGTLIKSGTPKLLEYQRDYICSSCHYVTIAKAVYENYYVINVPTKCGECHSSNLKPKEEISVSNFIDYQEIKVQEHFGKSKVGAVPKFIAVTLEGDLVDSCKPGDDVFVTGVLFRRWKQPKSGMQCDIDLVLKANNLELCCKKKKSASCNEAKEHFSNFWHHFKNQELIGRNYILKSFCPQIFGLHMVKLAIFMVLAGGVEKVDNNGFSARGMSHLLLIGDVGTGKSQLLRYASKIVKNSVYTTGVGSTNAGLTVTAVRENGDWHLEAGALVLADGGICCIDDFNSIREHDRTSIHEAMEQQSISVAKAGIVTRLHTRCSVLAAISAKYDSSLPMNVNLSISSPLLSRFDVVLVLQDSKRISWDRSLCNFIFEERNNKKQVQDFRNENFGDILWSIDDIQNYFLVIKNINPVMSTDAGIVLRAYYQFQRMTNDRNAARTTVRLLESLIRLSQGHARLMFREEVKVLDAVIAITIIELSMLNGGATVESNILLTGLPENPYIEYKAQATLILTKLKLFDILKKEIESVKKNNESPTSEILFLNHLDKSDYSYKTQKDNTPFSGSLIDSIENETFREIEKQEEKIKFEDNDGAKNKNKFFEDSEIKCFEKNTSLFSSFTLNSSKPKLLKVAEEQKGGKKYFFESDVLKTNKINKNDIYLKKTETSKEIEVNLNKELQLSSRKIKNVLCEADRRENNSSKLKNVFNKNDDDDDWTCLDF